jgi:hypothetical protein
MRMSIRHRESRKDKAAKAAKNTAKAPLFRRVSLMVGAAGAAVAAIFAIRHRHHGEAA